MRAGHAHASPVTAGAEHRRPLVIAFGLTAGFMVVELIAGLVFDSLALLSDAAHMGTDVLGLAMALAAITLAQRPSTAVRTFGTYRLEVLAALANGVLLFGVAGWVLLQAVRRFSDPAEVPGLPLLVVAVLGLLVNLVSFRLLTAGAKTSLNLRGAYLEVLGDMLGSVAVIVAAVIIGATGWSYADPIIGAAIGLFILPRTWSLTRQAVRVLMEAAPDSVDIYQLRQDLEAVAGVATIHDLHVWTLTSGIDSATAHVVLAERTPDQAADRSAGWEGARVLNEVRAVLTDGYGIAHVTVQCEAADHVEDAVSV